MGCFGGCFRGFRKSCGQFRARLCRRLIRGKIAPQKPSDLAASEKLHEEGSDRERDSRTPEALSQVVEEFVQNEIEKIKVLGQIQSDDVAEELMARGASIHEINEAARKERRDLMPTVDI